MKHAFTRMLIYLVEAAPPRRHEVVGEEIEAAAVRVVGLDHLFWVIRVVRVIWVIRVIISLELIGVVRVITVGWNTEA